jgi:hypothetical protein
MSIKALPNAIPEIAIFTSRSLAKQHCADEKFLVNFRPPREPPTVVSRQVDGHCIGAKEKSAIW